MIPIYLFNASPWGSLTKGYRLLNPLSLRGMREKNPYNIQRWRASLHLVSLMLLGHPPTPRNANVRKSKHVYTVSCIYHIGTNVFSADCLFGPSGAVCGADKCKKSGTTR